jgi:hypothetical protein
VTISKQAFYEGAALHILACSTHISGLSLSGRYFLLNGDTLVLFKHSTRKRGPWGFTLTPAEQADLAGRPNGSKVVLALICGTDGVAVISTSELHQIALPHTAALRIACSRRLGQHYQVSGPDGDLRRKVPPSRWSRLFLRGDEADEAS